jgi:uncharacterized protein (DUF305 family)
MRFHRTSGVSARRTLLASILLIGTGAFAASPDETAFLTQNDAAMKKMMTAMQIQPSGNVDADFVAMMVPHHQAAIDMAQSELRYGHNAELRRLAQQIITDQGREITTMRRALRQTAPAAPASMPSMRMP